MRCIYIHRMSEGTLADEEENLFLIESFGEKWRENEGKNRDKFTISKT